MKFKRLFITVTISVVIIAIISFRLVTNKKSFDTELKMVSELNATIPVITDTVRTLQAATDINATGSFEPFSDLTVASETQGKITKVNVVVGDIVKQSQVLAVTDAAVAESQYELAKYSFEKAKKDMERYRHLSDSDAVPAQQFEAVHQAMLAAEASFNTARTQLDNSSFRAPFGGIITKRYVETGSFISPGMPVFEIVDIHKVKLTASLTAAEAENIRKGMDAAVSSDLFPSESFHGKVTGINVKADASKRFAVEITVDNTNSLQLKPGMFGTVRFSLPGTDKSLVIQRAAISGSIKDPVVYVVSGDSVISHTIIAYPLNDKLVSVKSGLKDGDIIVVSGQINIKNGSRVSISK